VSKQQVLAVQALPSSTVHSELLVQPAATVTEPLHVDVPYPPFDGANEAVIVCDPAAKVAGSDTVAVPSLNTYPPESVEELVPI
jgi:hypothetical protein